MIGRAQNYLARPRGGLKVEQRRGRQAAVQVLTATGFLSLSLIRATLIFPAIVLDLATPRIGKVLWAIKTANWNAVFQRASHVSVAFGLAGSITMLYAAFILALVILSEPAKPYPRTTIYNINGNGVGPILVEFGPDGSAREL